MGSTKDRKGLFAVTEQENSTTGNKPKYYYSSEARKEAGWELSVWETQQSWAFLGGKMQTHQEKVSKKPIPSSISGTLTTQCWVTVCVANSFLTLPLCREGDRWGRLFPETSMRKKCLLQGASGLSPEKKLASWWLLKYVAVLHLHWKGRVLVLQAEPSSWDYLVYNQQTYSSRAYWTSSIKGLQYASLVSF